MTSSTMPPISPLASGRQRIAEELAAADRVVVIDEIQRLPELLNEVHRLIEERGTRFLLTRAVERGTLPSIYFSDDPQADLEAYAGSYLQQEIVAEALPLREPRGPPEAR
jgi:hypothetical protein